jgi:transposase
LKPKEFEQQYKDHLSGFTDWEQYEHVEEWMLFPQNLGPHLSIDEVAVTNGELWTTLTNKAAHGKKGALVAMIQGTKASDLAQVFDKLPASARETVTEVTLDMAANMELAVKQSFPRAKLVTDRFHVQQLVSEAVQDIRIELRRAALKEENDHMKHARKARKPYIPVVYENGDTTRQLLARSRYLLFKPSSKWKTQQTERAGILFRKYPQLKLGYDLSMMFRACYEHSTSIPEAREKLQAWYRKVEEKTMDTFLTAAESIRLHEPTILNYFLNRSTNASAESFNAKLKNFRALVRGVRDKKFHLFRIAKLYG